jgi:hypothetical protein
MTSYEDIMKNKEENKREETKWINRHIAFLSKLPDTVNNLVLCTAVRPFISDELFKRIVSSIPRHFISVSLPDMFNDGMKPDVIFSNLPAHITEVDITRSSNMRWSDRVGDYQGFTDEKIKSLLIHLPVTVNFITVMQREDGKDVKRRINLDVYRHINYFPVTYKDIASKSATIDHADSVLLSQARAILADYSKSDSWMNAWAVRLFTCHLGRNHVDEVDALLNDETINTFDGLYARLNRIRQENISNNTFNPTGSLARRIRYIELLKEQAQPSNVNGSDGYKLKVI